MTVGQPEHIYAGYDDPTGVSPRAAPRTGLDPVFEEEAETRGYAGLLHLDADPENGARATATVLTTVVVTAVARGEAGNDITLTVVDPGEETVWDTPRVEVEGTDIVVTLAEDDDDNLSTRGELAAALNSSPASNRLVSVAATSPSTEAAAVTETALTGGEDFTPAETMAMAVVNDGGDYSLWVAPGPVTALNTTEWVQVTDVLEAPGG